MTARGAVNARLEAGLRLRVRGPTGVETEVEAVVDTGFTGLLTLPTPVAAALGLLRRSGTRVTLADGSIRRFDVFAAEIEWGGGWRAVEVYALGTEVLVGMRLLSGHSLWVEVVPAGAVEVTRLPPVTPTHTNTPPAADLLSLVIPVYNERASLAPLLAEIGAVAAALPGKRVEVVFVDDGSSDGSWAEIRELATKFSMVRGLRFRRNFGKAAALRAGFTVAAGAIVFTLDADLQDDPREIPRFLDALDAGLDVVSGWKKVRHDPWHKVFPSRVFNGLVSRLTGVRLHDHNCGFKAYRAEVVREVRLYGELHRFVPILAAAEGFRVGEVVVHHRARKYGRSKFGTRRFVKGLLDLFSVRFVTAFGRRPMHPLGTFALLSGGAAGLLAVAAVGCDIYYPPLVLPVGAIGGVLVITATQAFLAGLVAELLVAKLSATDEPYRISDRTPDP